MRKGNEASARTDRSAAGRNLVVAPNFIRAVRESGYISLSTALAELVDNSLQAGATAIDITITRSARDAPPNIEVTDNGAGMTRMQLEACLQFGGSERFDDRRSFGRFGVGLPAASLSQSRHIEVISWRSGRQPLAVNLDVDEIAAGNPARLRASLHRRDVTTPSGSVVLWRSCDRIEYQRLAWLERALHRDLGRMFRRFLSGDVTLKINGARVKPVDPLFLTSVIEGRSASLAFEPLSYELATHDGGTSMVRVRFSFLPVDAWHRLDNLTKRRAGIVGSGGVSILRAGREIAFGWHLMGGKRKENYDDWWRCEIEFDPALDEHFGITINKQGVRPSARLREAIEPELESIARLLNARVRQAFEDVKFQEATQRSCRIAEAADPQLPVVAGGRGQRSADALSYRLTSDVIATDAMFVASLDHRTLHVSLNVDHPAFGALYKPLQALSGDDGANDLRTAIELLVLSFARAEVVRDGYLPESADLMATWSDTYAKMLQKL